MGIKIFYLKITQYIKALISFLLHFGSISRLFVVANGHWPLFRTSLVVFLSFREFVLCIAFGQNKD